jgi:alpha-methylacyl-CoA racemase
MTGWGQDGPRAHTAGHDITYIGLAGALHAIGSVPLNLVGDFGGGAMYLAAGILAALWEARSSGAGQVVDASIVDGTAHLMTLQWSMLAGGAWRVERDANLLDGAAPFYRVYETADGRHLAVGPLEPQFFAELLARLGISAEERYDYLDRDRWPHLASLLAEKFKQRTQHEWVEVFDGSDACVAPVLSMRQAAEDPHLRARHTFVTHEGVTQPAPAPRFSRTPTALTRPPALPGQHTDEILSDWLDQ